MHGLRVTPWNWVSAHESEEITMMGLPHGRKFSYTFSPFDTTPGRRIAE